MLKLFQSKIKILNYKSGILQDNKTLDPLPVHIIEVLSVHYLYMTLQENKHFYMLKIG